MLTYAEAPRIMSLNCTLYGGSGVTLCGGGCSFLRLYLDDRALDAMCLNRTLEDPSVLLFLQWLGTGVHFGTSLSLSLRNT